MQKTLNGNADPATATEEAKAALEEAEKDLTAREEVRVCPASLVVPNRVLS